MPLHNSRWMIVDMVVEEDIAAEVENVAMERGDTVVEGDTVAAEDTQVEDTVEIVV